MDWKVYYSDGTTFSDADGTWEQAPAMGVVLVIARDPTEVWGRFVLHNHEFYYKVNGSEVMCSERMELLETHVPGIKESQIKFGGNVWQQAWGEMLTRACNDPDFPKGSPRRRSTDWKGDSREPHYGRP